MHSEDGHSVGQGLDYSFDTTTGTFSTDVYVMPENGSLESVGTGVERSSSTLSTAKLPLPTQPLPFPPMIMPAWPGVAEAASSYRPTSSGRTSRFDASNWKFHDGMPVSE